MRIFLFMIMLMTIMNNVDATKIYIVNNTTFNLGNGANITLQSGQVLDENISLQPNFAPILHIRINGSEMRYSTISDKTISNITYNFSSDKFEFNASGLSDPLNMTAKMRRINVSYNFSVDTLVISSNKSGTDKQVSFTFNNWSQHNFIIEVNSSSILLFSVSGYVINKINVSLYNVNVTIVGEAYTHSDTGGYYSLSDLDSGSYVIKSILFPYSNKTISFNITDSDVNLNFTMKAQSGGTTYKEDYTPIYALTFMIVVVTIYMLRKNRMEK